MLSDQRTVLVTGKGRAPLTAEAGGGKVVALADPGAIAGLKSCTRDACRSRGEKVDGWINQVANLGAWARTRCSTNKTLLHGRP